MQPKIDILPPDLITRIFDEAFTLMMQPGIKVMLPEACDLLAEAGAHIDRNAQIAHIPESAARQTLETVPKSFDLFSTNDEPAVHYGGDTVHFNPGSSGVNVLDSQTFKHRPAVTADLVKVIKIAESLPQYDAQSTALVCSEIPKKIGDLYRLYLVMRNSRKPVVTGAFTTHTIKIMFQMLAIFSGGHDRLRKKPTAIFDVYPSPPLVWGEFGSQNLIDLARAGVPAQIVSIPLAGAAAPVTLIGSVVQHAAECISGMIIHQLAAPGAPIVWGGAPAIMDMRHSTTPMGAVETAMIDAAYTQVGKSLGFPTHSYLGASDAKVVDAQAGMESGITAMIGALAGINMISGAGMLDFLACVSPEKLVIDAEAIGMAKRMLQGIRLPTETLATEFFDSKIFTRDFLKQKTTQTLFEGEQFIPSAVIDRGSLRTWQQSGESDTFERAKSRVQEIVDAYQRPQIDKDQLRSLDRLVFSIARKSGLSTLPPH